MNSYAKFGGAARRHFSVICEKPMGGAHNMCPPPPAVRGLIALHKGSYMAPVWKNDSSCIKSFAPPNLKTVPTPMAMITEDLDVTFKNEDTMKE